MKKNADFDRIPFDQDFCEFLEFHLCRTFANSPDRMINSLWCDGILCDPPEKEQLARTRNLVAKAWIGKDGQDEYVMTVCFGNQSLSHYLNGLDLIDCVPSDETMDWMTLDVGKRTIGIRLK